MTLRAYWTHCLSRESRCWRIRAGHTRRYCVVARSTQRCSIRDVFHRIIASTAQSGIMSRRRFQAFVFIVAEGATSWTKVPVACLWIVAKASLSQACWQQQLKRYSYETEHGYLVPCDDILQHVRTSEFSIRMSLSAYDTANFIVLAMKSQVRSMEQHLTCRSNGFEFFTTYRSSPSSRFGIVRANFLNQSRFISTQGSRT